MFGKKNKNNDGYDDGYRQGREDATQELLNKMTELSLMNKRFAQALIDSARGQ